MRNIFAILLCLVSLAYAQQQTRVIGEVTARTAESLTVRTDAGQSVDVPITADTKVVRIPPGETSLSKATAITMNDVSTGDRVLARTNQIVVMSRSDLQQKQAAERAEWQKRGASGKITAISGESFTVATSGGPNLNISTSNQTSFRRYAPESVRFSDAKPSSFAELKVGDQVRILGDKTGDTIAAQAVVSGAFRNFAGTVVSVNAAGGEVTVTDLETKKPVTVKVNQDSSARRMPPQMAEMMARRRSAAGAGGDAEAAKAGPPAGGQARPGGFGGGGGGPRDIAQMLERFPALSLAELKPGDALIIASTAGPDPSRATAISVLAGVEPLLTGPPSDRRLSGAWSLDIGGMDF